MLQGLILGGQLALLLLQLRDAGLSVFPGGELGKLGLGPFYPRRDLDDLGEHLLQLLAAVLLQGGDSGQERLTARELLQIVRVPLQVGGLLLQLRQAALSLGLALLRRLQLRPEVGSVLFKLGDLGLQTFDLGAHRLAVSRDALQVASLFGVEVGQGLLPGSLDLLFRQGLSAGGAGVGLLEGELAGVDFFPVFPGFGHALFAVSDDALLAADLPLQPLDLSLQPVNLPLALADHGLL